MQACHMSVPMLQSSPVHPSAHVQVSGAEQTKFSSQVLLHIAIGREEDS